MILSVQIGGGADFFGSMISFGGELSAEEDSLQVLFSGRSLFLCVEVEDRKSLRCVDSV